MVVAVVVLGVLVVVLLVATVLLALAARERRGLVGRTVVVHTRRPDDRSLRGVLHAEHVDRLSLRESFILLPGGVEQPLSGIEHIPRQSISFVQEIEAKVPADS
jgi:hypothetical protein